jgi:hypothetical protein
MTRPTWMADDRMAPAWLFVGIETSTVSTKPYNLPPSGQFVGHQLLRSEPAGREDFSAQAQFSPYEALGSVDTLMCWARWAGLLYGQGSRDSWRMQCPEALRDVAGLGLLLHVRDVLCCGAVGRWSRSPRRRGGRHSRQAAACDAAFGWTQAGGGSRGSDEGPMLLPRQAVYSASGRSGHFVVDQSSAECLRRNFNN